MSFPRDAYPYTNFHELNLGYFIVHFREIFSQWADLYDQMLNWKDATDEELATWKADMEADLDQREAALRAELETWKAQTGQDIAGWEDATLAALTAWQTATQAVFEAIRVEAAGSASAAAASAGDAATAKTAAETAQAAAEAAAASVQASAAQIATNTGDIADLKTQLDDLEDGAFDITTTHGLNLLPPEYEQGYWDITTGEPVDNPSFTRSKNAIPVVSTGLNGLHVTTENGFSSNRVLVLCMDENDDVLGYYQFVSDNAQLMPTGTVAIKVYINGTTLTIPKVCISYTQISYEPYITVTTYKLKDDAAPVGVVEDIDNIKEYTDNFGPDESYFTPETILTAADAQYTNGMWLTDGTIATTTSALNYDAIDMMDVVPGVSYKITAFYGLYTLFDENGSNGTNSSLYTKYEDVTFTVPEGKYKIGISTRVGTWKNTLKFIRTTPTSEELATFPFKIDDFSLIPDNVVSFDTIELLAHLKGKKIVNFGDSLFGNFRDADGDNMSISAMLAKRTGATCYNAGFGGCRMAAHTLSNFDAFSMYQLAESINTGSWTVQDAAIAASDLLPTGDSNKLPAYFSDTLTMLKGIDWSTIDIITIGYGTNDYSGAVTEANFKTALDDSIRKIQTKYNNIKIQVISPMWRWFIVGGAYDHDSDTTTLPNYCQWCKDIAEANHVLYCDTYNVNINKYNYLQYFKATDGTHPNAKGRWARADKIAGSLLFNI